MKLHYIYQSCFLLETETQYYLFDYYKKKLPPLNTQKSITVFSSHFHKDHYNPEIFPMLKSMGMKKIFAVLSDDIKNPPEELPVLMVSENQSYSLLNGEILETYPSTDSGVAFLLKLSDTTIFHAGDLNDWQWNTATEEENKEMRKNYRTIIDRLSAKKIDLAFLPLDPRQKEHYADGLLYFLEHVPVQKVFPMHFWQKPRTPGMFLEQYPRYRKLVMNTIEY